jgi:phage FluMu protein gp41
LFGAVDVLPEPERPHRLKEVVRRLRTGICEQCGTTQGPLSIHQIRKLTDLRATTPRASLMVARHWETLVVCDSFHFHHLMHAPA